MSNTTDNFHSEQQGLTPSCRIAYILDNKQPVRCTMISDQPLFFMDFEEECALDLDDDGYFDFTAIESGVSALEEKIERLSGFTGLSDLPGEEERFASFLDNASAMFAPEPVLKAPADIKFLEKELRQSRLAAAFLDFAAQYGTGLMYDSQISGALYNRETGQIHINPGLAREERLLLTVRELRRAWQHRNGALLNPLTFHPDQAILVNRAQIADLSVMMIRVAWELQLAGEKDVWNRLENSSMADLCRAFARESYLDFRTLNNGVAQSAVFESWFLSERCRAEDKKLIQLMLADYKGYIFDTGHIAQGITADLVIALGTMPFGKNYLAPYVSTILNDTIFTEVRDRSNANFLWFIKFERSFRETEQELQTGKQSGGGDRSSHIKNKNIRFGDHEENSQIIPLPRGGQGSASSKAGRAQAAGGTIVQFRRRSTGEG